jgi:DNA-binding CsgD family transcriptional regulator
MPLGRADFQAILDFLARVDAVDDETPYGPEVREGLRTLIPCDKVGYDQSDLDARRFADTTPESADDDAFYWTVGPCPIAEYRSRTADATAARMSDVMGRARWHEHPLYRDYYRPVGLDQVIDLGLSPTRRTYRSLSLYRGGDVPDFSERDLQVLELLRPHFRAREARAALMATLRSPVGREAPSADAPDPRLTPREREIVALVAAGRTNAQIAAELWVTPATVKKHLENVYLKLGVGSRAAAASRVQSTG